MLGQFLANFGTLALCCGLTRRMEQAKALVESVVQAVMKSAAGFHRLSSDEFHFVESARAGDQEASEAPFAAPNAG